jgi:hypothetical protein
VTLRHLLTHTAGFQDPLTGADDDPRLSLGDYLARNQPPRRYPPGTVHVYSDYGYDLAGYLVQLRSGVSYERYVTDHILGPLGMTRTGFVGSAGAGDRERAGAYTPSGSGVTRTGGGSDGRAPSVGVVTTAADLGRFMTALLSGTGANGGRLLRPATVRLMRQRQFGYDPRTPGLTLGFAEAYPAGRRVVGHSGEGPGSHSMLTLVPDRGLGLVVTYDGDGLTRGAPFDGSYPAREQLRDAFVRAYAPGPAPAGRGATSDLPTGTYRWLTVGQHDPGLLLGLLSVPDLVVEPDGRGGLVTTGFSTGSSVARRHWDPAGVDLFRDRAGGETLLVHRDHRGRVTLLTTSYAYYSIALAPVPWYDSPPLAWAAIGSALLVLVTMLGWPVAALVRRWRGTTTRRRPGATAARWIAGAGGGLLVASVVAVQYRLVVAAQPAAPVSTVLLAGAGATTVAATVACTVLAWRRGWWRRAGRLHHTLVSGALVVLAAVTYHYDLLGLLPHAGTP